LGRQATTVIRDARIAWEFRYRGFETIEAVYAAAGARGTQDDLEGRLCRKLVVSGMRGPGSRGSIKAPRVACVSRVGVRIFENRSHLSTERDEAAIWKFEFRRKSKIEFPRIIRHIDFARGMEARILISRAVRNVEHFQRHSQYPCPDVVHLRGTSDVGDFDVTTNRARRWTVRCNSVISLPLLMRSGWFFSRCERDNSARKNSSSKRHQQHRKLNLAACVIEHVPGARRSGTSPLWSWNSHTNRRRESDVAILP